MRASVLPFQRTFRICSPAPNMHPFLALLHSRRERFGRHGVVQSLVTVLHPDGVSNRFAYVSVPQQHDASCSLRHPWLTLAYLDPLLSDCLAVCQYHHGGGLGQSISRAEASTLTACHSSFACARDVQVRGHDNLTARVDEAQGDIRKFLLLPLFVGGALPQPCASHTLLLPRDAYNKKNRIFQIDKGVRTAPHIRCCDPD